MIYDAISNIQNYKGLSKNLDVAIDFVMNTDLMSLPVGKTQVAGDAVFVNIMDAEAKPGEVLAFEIHKKYMDIQIDLVGIEAIEVALGEHSEIEAYNEERDIAFVQARQSVRCEMGAGRFIICMAEEPHKPGIAIHEDLVLKKCVVKVARTE